VQFNSSLFQSARVVHLSVSRPVLLLISNGLELTIFGYYVFYAKYGKWENIIEILSLSLFGSTSVLSMANDNPTRNGQGSQQPSESGRLNNLQRIAQRKQQVRSLPLSKKLEKLAVYSSCKV